MKVQGQITELKGYFAALVSSREHLAWSLHSTACPQTLTPGEERGHDRATREGRAVCFPVSRG